MSDPERIKRITDKLAALWATKPDKPLSEVVGDVEFDTGESLSGEYVTDRVLESALDAVLLQAGISPDAFAYEADVTAEGVAEMRRRADAHRNLTVEESQADQIDRYGSTISASDHGYMMERAPDWLSDPIFTGKK